MICCDRRSSSPSSPSNSLTKPPPPIATTSRRDESTMPERSSFNPSTVDPNMQRNPGYYHLRFTFRYPLFRIKPQLELTKVRGLARSCSTSDVRIRATWLVESFWGEWLFTQLTRSLQSRAGNGCRWPYPVVHQSRKGGVRQSASSSKAAARLCSPWTSVSCPKPTFVNFESGCLTSELCDELNNLCMRVSFVDLQCCNSNW